MSSELLSYLKLFYLKITLDNEIGKVIVWQYYEKTTTKQSNQAGRQQVKVSRAAWREQADVEPGYPRCQTVAGKDGKQPACLYRTPWWVIGPSLETVRGFFTVFRLVR